MTEARIWLPIPPSVNGYWKPTKGGGVMRSKKASAFKARARNLIQFAIPKNRLSSSLPFRGSVLVEVVLVPPDRARRDLDNLLKALLDSLESAGVVEDDSQVDRLVVTRGPVDKDGAGLLVRVSPFEPVLALPDWSQSCRFD